MFNRQIEVLIGNRTTGLLIRDLRVQFNIVKSISSEPNECTIKIFNLPKNELKALNIDYLECVINAGYVNQVGNIFNGQIDSYKFTREDSDLITEFVIKDGGKNYYNHVVNFTIAKNTNDKQLIDRLGLDTSHMSDINSTNRVRGCVVSGLSRDVLTQYAEKHGCEWSYQDNKLVFLNSSSTLSNEIVSLSYESGLITEPELIDDNSQKNSTNNIKFRCLLNPMLKIGGRVQLANTIINQSVTVGKRRSNQLNHDGIYKIQKITYAGDNISSGLDFYCEVEVKSV